MPSSDKQFSDETYNLRIQLDTKHCDCSPQEIEQMEDALDPLSRVTRTFPVSDLYVAIHYHVRSRDYHVKTSLVLSGRTLFTGERHQEMYPAYKRCIDKLVRKVTAYKRDLDASDERAKTLKRTHQEIVPDQVPDVQALQECVNEGDYPGFRNQTLMFEEQVRKRVGRWIQRYPVLNSLIGITLEVADLVEDVFLTAFDQFESKPANVMLGEWFEQLIDQVVHDLLRDPERELENIEMARSALDADRDGR